jgi:CBS-domain-containing membrane protein
MNVAFFLTPKSEVAWVPLRASMRQALEKMEHHRYSAIPVLDDEGHYVATLTEGDLLWKMKNSGLTFTDTERLPLSAVPRHLDVRAVRVDTNIEQLFSHAIDYNFVPIVDSRGVFMGIVRRRAIIEYFIELVAKERLTRGAPGS